MGHSPEQNEFLITYMNTLTYYDEVNKQIAALNLWKNGLSILQRATIFQNFEVFKKMEANELTPPNPNTIRPFIEDKIMDDTRIVTCFENFMKGILVLNNIVIHQLNRKKHNALRNDQEKRPILKSEVFVPESFSQLDVTKPETWETNFQTLNFNWMLKPSYQALINLPPDILLIIKKINEERNRLHFIISIRFEFGDSVKENFNKILNFVDTTIKKYINELEDKMRSRQRTIEK